MEKKTDGGAAQAVRGGGRGYSGRGRGRRRRQRRSAHDARAKRWREVSRPQHRRPGAGSVQGNSHVRHRSRRPPAAWGPAGVRKSGARRCAKARRTSPDCLDGADMVFIAAGMGGGTGTGAAALVAEIARKGGALAVGVATLPFGFEGPARRENAESGLRRLRQKADTLITVDNNRLLAALDGKVKLERAFRLADEALRQGVQGISDLVTVNGMINVDFADVKSIMEGGGAAFMAMGKRRRARGGGGRGEVRPLQPAVRRPARRRVRRSVQRRRRPRPDAWASSRSVGNNPARREPGRQRHIRRSPGQAHEEERERHPDSHRHRPPARRGDGERAGDACGNRRPRARSAANRPPPR